MNEKYSINKVYEEIKPSEQLVKKTSIVLKQELYKQQSTKRSTIHIKHVKKLAAISCIFALILGGVHLYDLNMFSSNIPDGEPLSKTVVNISGKISEVSTSGDKFKINGIWYAVDEKTEFADNVSNIFDKGNFINAYAAQTDTQNYIFIDIVFKNQEK